LINDTTNNYYSNTAYDSNSYRHGHNGIGYRNEQVIKPIATKNFIDEATGQAIGIKYYYAIPTDGSFKFETRGRHITEDQIFIPKKSTFEVKKTVRSSTNNRMSVKTSTTDVSAKTIDQKDPNWVYAAPVIASLTG